MTQATTIALIRHGQTAWNADFRIQGRTDIPLNDIGRSQARAAAEELTGDWHVISSSPLSRASETAEIIAEGLGLGSPFVLDHLTERHFGLAEGLGDSAELDRVRTADGFIGSEAQSEVANRGLRALEHLRDTYTGQNILAVSHGAFIRITLSRLFGIDAPRINNTAVSLITHDENGWFLETVNGVPARELA